MGAVLLLGSFTILLLLNVPIAACLGLSSLISLFGTGMSFNMVAINYFTACNKFVLLAIPFFILAGNIMEKAQISTKLIDFAQSLIEGADGAQVMTAADVLSLKANPGKRVVIVGGGQVGCETAAFLANQSRDVTILEMMPVIPVEGEPGVNYYLKQDLDAHNVVQIAGAKVLSIGADAVVYEKNGEKHVVKAVNNVVLAIGSRPVNALGEALAGLAPKIEIVGDASKPGKGLVAHAQGFAAGYYV